MGRLRFRLARGFASLILSGLCGADAFAASAAPAPVVGPATTTSRSSTRSNAIDFDFVLKGNQAFQGGNRSNAIYFFTQAIAANPTNTIAYYYVGLYFDATGEAAKAIDFLGKAVGIKAPNALMLEVARAQLKARKASRTPDGSAPK